MWQHFFSIAESIEYFKSNLVTLATHITRRRNQCGSVIYRSSCPEVELKIGKDLQRC